VCEAQCGGSGKLAKRNHDAFFFLYSCCLLPRCHVAVCLRTASRHAARVWVWSAPVEEKHAKFVCCVYVGEARWILKEARAGEGILRVWTCCFSSCAQEIRNCAAC
jgi:hypothetical protein